MDVIIKKLVSDLVKGAAQTEGFVRGSRMRVDLGGDLVGQKVAGHSGIGAAFGGPLGAALGADPGQELEAAKGSFMGGLKGTGVGGLAGGGLGALLAALAHEPALAGALPGAAVGAGLGSYVGNVAGAAGAGDKPSFMDRLKGASVEGSKGAAARFGVKEAFLPLLGAIAGPMLARAGVGALARGVGGRLLGGIAGKVAPRIAGGLGGAAFDQAASAAGGALGNKMMPQQPQGMMG